MTGIFCLQLYYCVVNRHLFGQGLDDKMVEILSQIVNAYYSFLHERKCNVINRASVVNDVDSSSFNYSVEEPILREYGTFRDINHDYSFGVVQPCIRTRDAAHLEDDTLHLSQFSIMPLPFSFYAQKENINDKCARFLHDVLLFLYGLGLDVTRLYVTYFSGGYFDAMVRSPNHVYLPPDYVTRNTCLAAGIPEQNIIPNATTDTFLCSSRFSEEFYAGYRYEVFYEIRPEIRCEIATGETLLWLQKTQEFQTELLEMPGAALVVGLGLERCIMAIEDKVEISQISMIEPLVNALRIEEGAAFKLVDSLRAIQLIFHDVEGYSKLNRHQRNHVRMFFHRIVTITRKYSISDDILGELLQKNTEIQGPIIGISSCIDTVLSEIKLYEQRVAKE